METGQEEPQLLDNALIITLTNSDVTVAQDDWQGVEGIIPIPDETWNHIVTDVEHPEQEWFNSMYLNVKALTIGFTKIDIIGFTYNNVDYYLSDMTEVTQSTNYALTTGNSLIKIGIEQDDYILTFIVNNTGNTINYTWTGGYYKVINSVSYSSVIFKSIDNVPVFKLFDLNTDNNSNTTYIYKNSFNLMFKYIELNHSCSGCSTSVTI